MVICCKLTNILSCNLTSNLDLRWNGTKCVVMIDFIFSLVRSRILRKPIASLDSVDLKHLGQNLLMVGNRSKLSTKKLSYILGARKLRNLEVDGVRELAMWDKSYETMTNQVIIAFDLDDDFSHLKGFKLK